MKKLIIITIGVIVAIVIGFLIWKAVFPKPDRGALPQTGETQRLRVVSKNPVFDYWLGPNDEIFYLSLSGSIHKILPTGDEDIIIEQTIPDLNSVQASSDGLKVIISFGYPLKEIFSVFDTKNRTFTPLPEGTTAVAWHPTSSDQIVYLRINGSRSALYRFSLTTKQSSEIIQINQRDFGLQWTSANEIYLTERPTRLYPSALRLLDIQARTIKNVIQDSPALMIKWFFNGTFGVKFTINKELPLIQVIDENNKTLAFISMAAIPENCVLEDGENNLYCAASAPENVISDFPDGYLKNSARFNDNIYRIPLDLGINEDLSKFAFNILDGAREIGDATIRHPKKSADSLLFINRANQSLYVLEL